MSNIRLKDPIKFIVAKVKECVEEACDTTYTKRWVDDYPSELVVSKGKESLLERIAELVEAKLREQLDVE